MNKAPEPQPKKNPDNLAVGFDINNPELQAAVSEFIAETGAAELGKEAPQIKPNNDFDIPNPHDTMLTEALISTNQVTVNDTEKAIYLKAVLNEVPVRMVIELINGQMKVECRSRTIHEQRRIFDVLQRDQTGDDAIFEQNDVAYMTTRLKQYCMALIITRVDGKVFSEASIPETATVDEARKILHDAVAPMAKMSNVRWTALLNAMNIFEAKCALMGTEVANPDFWKPREQG